jgi:hypothetical protein
MDEDNKDLEMSPEEQNAEEEATREVDDNELREDLAEKMGIDPDEQSELLDKIVEREKANRERLSGAIKQKISWRDKAQERLTEKPKDNPKEGDNPKTQEVPDIDKLVDQKLTERWEARELESLELSDELKDEVKDLAKLKGISVREAAQHPYILQRKEEAEKEERIRNATPKRSKKGTHVPDYDPSKPLNPEDFDFNSEEGVKAWKEAKAAREKWNAQQK